MSYRHSEILEVARREGRVTVEDLADRFSVTHQTIRRDLTELAEAGRLERIHGGAILPSGIANLGYEDRRSLNEEPKSRIARVCAARIPENASVFLSIGTSTEAVATQLLHHRALLVVTNNMNVANILAANPDCQVVVTGGTLRRSDGGLVGEIAAKTILQFKFDIAVIGCSAIDSDGDLLDFDLQEVNVATAILKRTRRSYLVADHSKFQRSAPVLITSLAQIDTFFTDVPLPGRLAARCEEWDTEIVIAP